MSNKEPWKRWKSWKALDSGRSEGADARAARLDQMLRAGAADQVGAGDGRLRWRVLGAISAEQPASKSTHAIAGRIGWRSGVLAACAVLALGLGAYWLGPMATSTGGGTPGNGIATMQPAAPDRDDSKLQALIFLQSPMTALAATLDQPFERETQKLMTDARKMASYFAERITAPIAALNRSGASENERPPTVDDLHAGGA
jgi:hypothetical protein